MVGILMAMVAEWLPPWFAFLLSLLEHGDSRLAFLLGDQGASALVEAIAKEHGLILGLGHRFLSPDQPPVVYFPFELFVYLRVQALKVQGGKELFRSLFL